VELAMARALQGYLMGPMLGACRILIQLSFTPKERGQATRIFLFSILLCSALAPLVGGYLVAAFGWRAVFLATLPAGLLIGLLVLLVVPSTGRLPREKRSEAHLLPYVVAALALGALQVVVQQLNFAQFSDSPLLEGLTACGLLLLGVFVWQQWNHPRPLLRFHGLKEATFRTGLMLYALYYFINNALGYLISRFLQGGLGYPVESAGHLVGMTSLASLGGALIYFRYAGLVSHKKWIFIPGFLLTAFIGGWMASMPPDVSASWLLLPLTLRGLLLMFVALPVANIAFQNFAMELYPHSYRIKNIVKQIAYSFSTATIIVFEQHRVAIHQTNLSTNVSANNPVFRHALEKLTHHFEQAGQSLSAAHDLALSQILKLVADQSNFMSYLDGFQFIAILSTGAAIFALWQRRID
jgi:MFS family permease